MVESTARLIDALQLKIDYFRREYDLTYGEVIGALECLKLNLWDEVCEEREE